MIYLIKKISFLSNIFLLFSTILFCYIFYRAELYHSGLKNDYYLKFYIISLLLIFFSLLSYLINNSIKIKIIKLLTLVICSFYTAESILTFIFINALDKQKIKLENKIKDNSNFDERVPWKAYQDLKKQNSALFYYRSPKAFINIDGQNFSIKKRIKKHVTTILPVSGISKAKNFTSKENGYYPSYENDRYGFRNLDNEWDKELIEFFLIGDSYLMATSFKASIGENLRKNVKNNNGILTLAHGGFGTLYQHAMLREYLPRVKAKRVVLFYNEVNDLDNLSDELNNIKLSNYLNNKNYTQNLHLKQDIIDKMYIEKFNTSNEYKLNNYETNRTLPQQIEDSKGINWYYFLKLYKLRNITFERFFRKPNKEFKNILKLSKEFTEKNGAKFYVVYVPQINRYIKGLPISNVSQNYKKIIKILKNLKIEYIDLHRELFLKVENPLIYFPFETYGHSNELGFQAVARMINKKFF